MVDIVLIDGRTIDFRTWLRNLFIDATSFNYNDSVKKGNEVIVFTAGIRHLTLATLNTILETLKLNKYKVEPNTVQWRAQSHVSFTFYMFIVKEEEQ